MFVRSSGKDALDNIKILALCTAVCTDFAYSMQIIRS